MLEIGQTLLKCNVSKVLSTFYEIKVVILVFHI